MSAAVLRQAERACAKAIRELDAAADTVAETDAALAMQLRMTSGMLRRYSKAFEPSAPADPSAAFRHHLGGTT